MLPKYLRGLVDSLCILLLQLQEQYKLIVRDTDKAGIPGEFLACFGPVRSNIRQHKARNYPPLCCENTRKHLFKTNSIFLQKYFQLVLTIFRVTEGGVAVAIARYTWRVNSPIWRVASKPRGTHF